MQFLKNPSRGEKLAAMFWLKSWCHAGILLHPRKMGSFIRPWQRGRFHQIHSAIWCQNVTVSGKLGNMRLHASDCDVQKDCKGMKTFPLCSRYRATLQESYSFIIISPLCVTSKLVRCMWCGVCVKSSANILLMSADDDSNRFQPEFDF